MPVSNNRDMANELAWESWFSADGTHANNKRLAMRGRREMKLIQREKNIGNKKV